MDQTASLAGQIYCTAFQGLKRIASGLLPDVASKAKEVVDQGGDVLILDDATSRPIEVDFRGTLRDVVERLSSEPTNSTETQRGPGRPKLGVVAREVTLLPRHWDWLNSQTGGASVTLRKLVDEARRRSEAGDRKRTAREVAYRFMSTIAGDLPKFEDVSRALFAGDAARFGELIADWPADIRDHAQGLAVPAFEET